MQANDDGIFGQIAEYLCLEDRFSLAKTCKSIYAVIGIDRIIDNTCTQLDAAKYGSVAFSRYVERIYGNSDMYACFVAALDCGARELAAYAFGRCSSDPRAVIAALLSGQYIVQPRGTGDPTSYSCALIGGNSGNFEQFDASYRDSAKEAAAVRGYGGDEPRIALLKGGESDDYGCYLVRGFLANTLVALHSVTTIRIAVDEFPSLRAKIAAEAVKIGRFRLVWAIDGVNAMRDLIMRLGYPDIRATEHMTIYELAEICSGSAIKHHTIATSMRIAGCPKLREDVATIDTCRSRTCAMCEQRVSPGKFYCRYHSSNAAMRVWITLGDYAEVHAVGAKTGDCHAAVVHIQTNYVRAITTTAYFELAGPLGLPIFVSNLCIDDPANDAMAKEAAGITGPELPVTAVKFRLGDPVWPEQAEYRALLVVTLVNTKIVKARIAAYES